MSSGGRAARRIGLGYGFGRAGSAVCAARIGGIVNVRMQVASIVVRTFMFISRLILSGLSGIVEPRRSLQRGLAQRTDNKWCTENWLRIGIFVCLAHSLDANKTTEVK
jgi:hypothetical protein